MLNDGESIFKEEYTKDSEQASTEETQVEDKVTEEAVTEEEEVSIDETKVEEKETEEASKEEESKVEDSTEEQQTPEYLSKLKEFAGEEFNIEGDDDIKTIFEKARKVSDLESEIEKTKTTIDEYNQMKDWFDEQAKVDPTEQYGGPDGYKKTKVLDWFKDKGYNMSAATSLIGNDLSKMDPLNLIASRALLESPRLGSDLSGVKETMLKQIVNADPNEEFDINDTLANLTPDQQRKLNLEADKVEKEIKGLIEGVDVPTPTNAFLERKQRLEAKQQQAAELTEKWTNDYEKDIRDALDKIELEDYDFSFEIEEAFKNGEIQRAIESAAKNGLEPTDKNKRVIVKAIKAEYKRLNDAKITKALVKEVEARAKGKVSDKVNNTAKINQKTKPPEQGEKESVKNFESRMMSMLTRGPND